MHPNKKQTEESERAEKKNQYNNILTTAGELFLSQGYQETSIRQIARGLGVSSGLIGYYFPSKRDIAVTLFSEQLAKIKALSHQYVSSEDPVLRSAVLIKLQITVLNSSRFRKLYMEALREDIILTVIQASGLETYLAINEKYHLNYSEQYLSTNNLLAASMERTLVLYSNYTQREESVADLVFLVPMERMYGTDEFLKQKCQESELITARILCDHPEVLNGWL